MNPHKNFNASTNSYDKTKTDAHNNLHLKATNGRRVVAAARAIHFYENEKRPEPIHESNRARQCASWLRDAIKNYMTGKKIPHTHRQ